MHRFGFRWIALFAFAVLSGGAVNAADDRAASASETAEPDSQQVGFFKGWNLLGSNTLRLDQYGTSGPDTSSPYPDEGFQVYDEFNIGLHKAEGPYKRWRGQLALLLNRNDYRSQDTGVVPERINLTREAGDRKLGGQLLPYRWEAGDYFSYFSYMTLQSSLKGLQVELQPRFGERVDSLVLFAGTNETRWQELTVEDDYSAGGSYLFELDRIASFSVNGVFNQRKGDADVGSRTRDQGVVSATAQRDFVVWDNEIAIETEHAFFSGDYFDAGTAGNARNQDGHGHMLEVRGNHESMPLDYRFRGELYDENYRPRGSIVSADRRSGEIHAGWRFDSGLRLRGRIQGYEDGWEQDDSTETRLGGVNLSGPVFPETFPGINGNTDFFIQHVDGPGQDALEYHFRSDLGRALCEDWYGRIGFSGDISDDLSGANTGDQQSWDANASVDYSFSLAGFDGIVTPGLRISFDRDAVHKDEVNPTAALRVNRDAHSLGFDYGTRVQHVRGDDATDSDQHTLSADYRYQRGKNLFGAEFNYFGRRPDPGSAAADEDDTDAWRVGVYWTLNFAHPPPVTPASMPRSAAPGQLTPRDGAPPPDSGPIDSIDMAQLAPGLPFATTRVQLAKLGLPRASRQGDIDVFEYAVLPRIEGRQRLALVESRGILTASVLIIDFNDTGSLDSTAQLFERVRKELIDRYGAPTSLHEEGEFSDQLVRDVNSQRFTRTVEWQTSSGTLRFGIPRRFDGQVRMEIQHRAAFSPPRNTLWSLEAVR